MNYDIGALFEHQCWYSGDPPWGTDSSSTPRHCMVAAGEVRVASVTGSPLHELLAAVDVVGCSGDGCVRHEVDGERGDVGRAIVVEARSQSLAKQ